tara:strand:- start:408 stop:965 length:558 start_codon:yes stop_codon:yes gene_type:complete
MSWLRRVSKKYPNWNISPPPNAMPFVSSAGFGVSALAPPPQRQTILRLKNDRNSWMSITEISTSGFANVSGVAPVETPVNLGEASIIGKFSWFPSVNGSGCIQTSSRADGALFGPLFIGGEITSTGFNTLFTYSVKNGAQAIFVGPGDEFKIEIFLADPNRGATPVQDQQYSFTVIGYQMLLPSN